jgi:hypothetical protein
MVYSLLRDHPLKGMDRSAVVALLGEPTHTDDSSELIYVLGPGGGLFPIDNEWLLIRLNPQGRVSGYRVEVT